MTLGYSGLLVMDVASDQQVGTLLRLLEEAFRHFGGVPREILLGFLPEHKIRFDRMKTDG